MNPIFLYDDYVSYLYQLIADSNRGIITDLARACGSQKSYFSQVAKGKLPMTLEQAIALCDFWEFNAQEREYFVALVGLNRAGTPKLQRYYQSKLAALKGEWTNLKNHFDVQDKFEPPIRYYSSWIYSAVHILISIPRYRTEQTIATRLDVPTTVVSEVLKWLSENGFATKQGSEWRITPKDIHLPRDSVMTIPNHTNWRQKALACMQLDFQKHLHYTSVFTLSVEDLHLVREQIQQLIVKTRKQITKSEEEVMACFCCDFFEV